VSTSLPIKAGHVSSWRSVQEGMRSSHEDHAKAIREAIADRKKKGVPVDDLVDWRVELGDVLDKAEGLKEREDLRALLEKGLAIVNGGLREPPAYKPDPSLDGVEVRLRAISKADLFEHNADMASVDDGDLLRALAKRQRVARSLLRKALAGVRGLLLDSGERLSIDGLSAGHPELEEVLNLLDECGVFGAIYSVARTYQDLPVPSRAVFALPPASISGRSTAAPAQAPGEGCSVVTVAQPDPSSPTTIAGELTPALVGTSSTSQPSETPSPSIASSATSQG